MSSEPWQSIERKFSSRRTQLLLCLGLLITFVSVRWLLRFEPWNSDDMDLFQLAEDAAAGRHWVLGTASGGPGSPVPHPAFRIGLLPLAVPAIKVFGAGATAFYFVPLAFALLAFGALYWVILRNFGPLLALAFAAIHLVWPFELEHSSLFLTDLPAAASGLVSLCLLELASCRTGWSRRICVLWAGLAAVETYLLRNNSLLLLGPAYLVFFWNRSTRWLSVGAGAVIVVGVFAQQLFLVYRGFSWGHDWSSVRADFADYAKFLPVYSWKAFLTRQFAYQVTTFGRGATGVLAAALVAASLVLHVLVLRFERRPLVLAVAVFGLFSWLLFSFSIYERVPGGVRAMVPVNFRYVQPFTYSSLVIWAWSATALRGRSRWETARAVVPALLFACAGWISAGRLSQTYLQSGTRRLLGVLEARLAENVGPGVIAGIDMSLRVPRLFWGNDAARRGEWRELSPSALGDLVEGRGAALVLRDVPRELGMARYLAPEARQNYRAELARIDGSLWRRDEFAYLDGKYALFAPPRAGVTEPPQLRSDAATPPVEPPGTGLLEVAPCDSRGPDADKTLLPIQSGLRRASCEFTRSTDGLVLPLSEAHESGQGFVLRVDADFESPVAVAVQLVESDAGRRLLRRERSLMAGGASYIPVSPRPGTRELFVVYRIGSRGSEELQPVRVRPAAWRPYHFREAASGMGTPRSDGSDPASAE